MDQIPLAIDLIEYYLSPQNLISDRLTAMLLKSNDSGIDLYYMNRNYPKLRHFQIPTPDLAARLKSSQLLVITAKDTKFFVRPRSLETLETAFVSNAPPLLPAKLLQQIVPFKLVQAQNQLLAVRAEGLKIAPFRSVEKQQEAFQFYQQRRVHKGNFEALKEQILAFLEVTESASFMPNTVLNQQQKVVKIIDLGDAQKAAVQAACERFGKVKFMRYSCGGRFAQVFFDGVLQNFPEIEAGISVGGELKSVVVMK
ncbi:hypothetical protein SS50377_27371 [Spironucleus salmonicida]|uniref:Uncharacterized protein n=1 Tax=Spironucleus salmonicida TaxID=348837 RepID=V6LFQ3_9EUKA|nr:hypothetical protein SS50377_27371 [Spironucleus salmonicida]|eukprot:EST43327.1 Hypothetical protein SS50377_17004 [Spironucleus salmonicida]